MIDLLIRNGIIVTPDAIIPGDVAIQGEKILAIGNSGSFTDAIKEVDAAGCYVLPGLIDPHLHMAHPYKDEISDDDIYSTSVSAAFGGNTTLIDFAIQWDKELALAEVIERRRDSIEGESVLDFGLHATPTKSTIDTIQSVEPAIKLGVPTYKVYMIYRSQGRMVDDAVLYGLLAKMKLFNGRLMVHAENAYIAEYNQQLFVENGQVTANYFPLYKPNIVEAEAVNRALYFNHVTKSRLYIAHLTTSDALELLRRAQASGDDALGETCTHYLTLTDREYSKKDGHNFICSPPLRSQDDVDALWRGLADGTLSIVSSDHCGFGLRQKNLGAGNFVNTPNGLPGIELRLPVLFTEGVLKNRITLKRMVELLSTNPAKIFGLYPEKGAILPGSDADITIIDGKQSKKVAAKELHGNVDWSPFEGMELKGFAVSTILRGKVIVEKESLTVNKGYGKFIRRHFDE